MTGVSILCGARTPHGKFLGGLQDASAVELGVHAVRGVLERLDRPAEAVDWVALGNAVAAGLGQVPARQAVLESGLPETTPATTVNEASGSGLRAIALGVDRIAAGEADLVVAGGMESMSNAPYLVEDHRQGVRHGHGTLVDAMIWDSLWDVTCDAHMGELTEELVERFDISRRSQDRYAVESHRRASRSIEEGRFSAEVVPVEAGGDELAVDEGPRPDTNIDAVSRLEPAFRSNGTITPANASDLGDGAGCVALGDRDALADHGVAPLVDVVDYAVSYRDPKWFGMALGDAVERLLDANDLRPTDVDQFELNEAFAAQMVYVRDRLDIPAERLNPYGGAIALGHPVGASGGILTATLAHALADRDGSLGVVGMSVGGGGGMAMLLRSA